MNLNLYTISQNILGNLPEYLHFIYGILTLLLAIGVFILIFSPLIFLYSFIKGKN